MRGLKKTKRVCWASDNLCQVRLFLSEESPSQIGLGAQDHLQAKSSWQSHPTGSDDFLPPGFEGSHTSSHLQIRVSEIPVIKWRCPPRLVLNLTWQVVAGEESKEIEVQNEREMRVLEAVYPRPSAIPPNPTFSVDAESCQHNDHQILLIPITPIEDEDAADTPSDVLGPSTVPTSTQAQLLASGVPSSQSSSSSISSIPVNGKPTAGGVPGVEPDVLAAASAAFAAVNKGNEQGSLIDHGLLIKILSNPKLVEKLATDYGAAVNAQDVPKHPLSDPPPPHATLPNSAHSPINRTECSAQASLTATPSVPFYTQPNGVGMGVMPNARFPPPPAAPSTPSIRGTQAKDINYYKNLIQQHGGDRQETPQHQQFGSRYNHQVGSSQDIANPKSRESKPKIMKPCIYFNSSRGCRNGANCAYQHDASAQQKGSNSTPEVQNAKRMKMDREISS